MIPRIKRQNRGSESKTPNRDQCHVTERTISLKMRDESDRQRCAKKRKKKKGVGGAGGHLSQWVVLREEGPNRLPIHLTSREVNEPLAILRAILNLHHFHCQIHIKIHIRNKEN